MLTRYAHIFQTFKEEIERSDQPGGPLLDATDVKLIFGKIPPIYDTHMKMRDELNDIINNWRNDRSVGDVILKHVSIAKIGRFVFFAMFSSVTSLFTHTYL